MSDIVEQAARVLNSVATSWGAADDWEKWREEAQALADAGLLRDNPAPALITTVEQLEALPVGTGIRTQTGAIAVKQDTTDFPWHVADGTSDRFTNVGMIECFTWPFIVLAAPTHPTPTRDEVIEAISAALHLTTDRIPGLNPGPVLTADGATVTVAADAVLELLAGDPQ